MTVSKKSQKTTGGPKRGFYGLLPGGGPVQQGKKAFLKKEYDQAILHWQMARAERSLSETERTRLIAALAEAYFRRGIEKTARDKAAACADLVEAAQLQPGDALYAYHAGLGWHRRGSLSQAISYYRRALQINPNFRRAAYPLALALAESGQDVQRDSVWSQLDEAQRARLQHMPGSGGLEQALALLAGGKWEQAGQALSGSQWTDQPVLAQALAAYYAGVVKERAGDHAGALILWQQAHNQGLKTAHPTANLTLDYTLRAEAALTAGRHDEALGYVGKGLSIEPAHPRLADIQAQIHLERGYAAAEKGDWSKTLKEWRSVTNAEGTNARALSANLAIAHEKMENWQEAAEAWREFARRRPRKETAEGWLSPAQVARLWARVSQLYAKNGDLAEAIVTLQTALKHQPDNSELGLALAQCYINDERADAAHNQIDRVLKQDPTLIEALVLKAELSEVAPPRGWYGPSYVPGIPQWEAVLAAGDEGYASVAKQHLAQLYEESFNRALMWGGPVMARQAAQTGLKTLPDNHFLRALLVEALLADLPRNKKPREQREAEIREHIAQIDLSDLNALHQLIDIAHKYKRHPEAATFLDQANGIKPLDSAFYMGIASCALHRKQTEIAERYFDEAQRRASDELVRRRVRVETGMSYAEHRMDDKAEAIWLAILKEYPDYGYVHYALWILNHQRNNRRAAQDHLRQAQRWASEHKDAELKAGIERTHAMLNTPLHKILPPNFNPDQLPPKILEQILDNLDQFSEDDDDDLDLDNFDFLPPSGRPRQGRGKKR